MTKREVKNRRSHKLFFPHWESFHVRVWESYPLIVAEGGFVDLCLAIFSLRLLLPVGRSFPTSPPPIRPRLPHIVAPIDLPPPPFFTPELQIWVPQRNKEQRIVFVDKRNGTKCDPCGWLCSAIRVSAWSMLPPTLQPAVSVAPPCRCSPLLPKMYCLW